MTHFIVFEGIDGSGKDTQMNLTSDYIRLYNKYANIWLTREPTRITNPGLTVSKLLQNDIPKDEAVRYFILDRKEHSNMIKSTLQHSHVLTSRYDLSTYAYQLSQNNNSDNIDFDFLYNMHNYTNINNNINNRYPDRLRRSELDYVDHNSTIIPDITFYFDVSVEVAVERIERRNSRDGTVSDYFETRNFLEKVSAEYDNTIRKIKEKSERRIITVNADNDIEYVNEELNRYLDQLIF
jgi:dTMP kinase